MYFALKVMMRSFKYSHALTPSIAATAQYYHGLLFQCLAPRRYSIGERTGREKDRKKVREKGRKKERERIKERNQGEIPKMNNLGILFNMR